MKTKPIQVFLEEELHTEFKIKLIRDGKKMNEFLTEKIKEYVEGDKK